jgi:hypothetical protein
MAEVEEMPRVKDEHAPTYEEMLREYVDRAGVEGRDELWQFFEERLPWVFVREVFELCYEGR